MLGVRVFFIIPKNKGRAYIYEQVRNILRMHRDKIT